MSSANIVAMMTDFGGPDPYVGVMKGVILGIHQNAVIVDLSHDIAPGDIRSAAFALRMAIDYFPKGTIFLTVVDPGVGTSRRGIAVEIAGRTFVGPDNGLLSWVLESSEFDRGVELTNEDFFLPNASGTFHGRDIFAPVAAHLCNGTSIEELGKPIDDIIRFDLPKICATESSLQGEVVYIDRFGNLLTNIKNEEFIRWRDGIGGGAVRVNLGSMEIKDFGRTYGIVMRDHPVIVFGGEGVLEVAVNGGTASESFGAGIGTQVTAYHIGA
jgi:hypothetical protein